MSPSRMGGTLIVLAAFLFVALVGGTDAGRYVTAVRAFTAVIGAGFVLVWIWRAGREADAVDRLVVAGLLAFLLACMVSDHARDSFEAATTALAFAAAAFVARGAVRGASQQALAIAVMGLCGLVLSAAFAVVWGMSWLRWIGTTGGMLPPLDLILPVGPYRHYHVVGTTVAVLLPALFVLARRPVIWPLAWLGISCSAVVVVMSGSRTVWLALVGGLIVTLAVLARGGRLRVPGRWWWGAVSIAGATVVAAVLTGLAGPVMTRLFGSSTVSLRGALWEATIARWLVDPVFGAGPGSFSTEITLSGFFATYDGIGRHADNAVIQALAEAGLPGLTALAFIVSAAVLGLRREGWPLAPTVALATFGLASLTDNPSDSAHLVAIAIVWFALASPRPPHSPSPAATQAAVRTASSTAAVVVAIATMSLLGASWAYDEARALRAAGDEAGVRQALSRAAALDPSFALYQRELGLALLVNGALDDAADRLGRASELNRGDLTTLRTQAYLRLLMDDSAAALMHAGRAMELGGSRARNSLLQAFVGQSSGDAATTDGALVHSLRFDPWLGASPGWHAAFPTGERLQSLLTRASDAWLTEGDPSGRNGMAVAWVHGMVGRPSGTATAAIAATNAILRCDIAEADAVIGSLTGAETSSVSGLIAQLMAARIADRDPTELLVLARVRWPLLGHLATAEQSAMSPFNDPDEDARIYRRLGMPALEFGPLLPTSDAGLSAWLRDPVAAADAGAPGSGLADCR